MKKAVSLMLAMLMLLSVVSFADGNGEASETNQLVLRTVLENDFDNETVGTLPSPFGGWKTNGIDRSVQNFGDGKALHMKATYENGKRPDNVLELKRSFEGKYVIDFDLWVESADQIYIAAKEQVNNLVWMYGMFIKENGAVSFAEGVGNTGITIDPIAYKTWHDITIVMDSTAGTYSYYVDEKPYIKDVQFRNGFQFSNVSFRIQEYGITVGKTSELYIDNFSVKRYDAAPTITLKGEKTMKVAQGKTFTEPGYTVTDPIDSDLAAKVKVTGEVDVNTPGDYTLAYDVTAKDGTEAETVYRTVTVTSKAEGKRIFVDEDMQNISVGGRPDANEKWANNGASLGVAQVGNDKKLHFEAPYNGSKNPDATLGYNISKIPNPTISFDFTIEKDGNTFQALAKDTKNSKIVVFFSVTDGTVKFCDQAVGTVSVGEEHSVKLEINHTARTVSAYLDGEKKLTAYNFRAAGLLWDPDNMIWRFQMYNNKKNTEMSAYLDNILILTEAKPVISLKGAANADAVRGEAFKDPGYTATDVIDGDITDKVKVTGEVNIEKEGTYTLSYDVTAKDGTKAETVQRKVTVKKKQIIKDAVITADSEQPGFEAGKVADEDADSAWKSASQNPSLVLDFGRKTLMETVTVYHEGVTGVQALYTEDGNTWKKAAFSETNAAGVLTLRADVFAAKAIRLAFDGEDTAIYEIKAETADESVAAYVLKLAEQSLPSDTEKIGKNITLATDFGYGATVAWSSNREDILSSDGTVVLPETETAVTLTASATYAQSTKTKIFSPLTVKSKTSGLRTLLNEDMEKVSVGARPTSADESWASNGASVGVVQDGNNKKLYFEAPYNGSASPDGVVGYHLSDIKDPTISFDFSIEKAGNAFQALLKDNTNSKNFRFAAVENDTLKLCEEEVGKAEVGRTYHVKLELHNDTGTVSAWLDGVQKVNNHVFAAAGSRWDFSNQVWRFQVYNFNKGTELAAYVDNFMIQSNVLPVIALKGESELTLLAGMTFEDPGATATDILDGDISEKIVVSDLPDMNTVGTYRVKYTVCAEDGTEAEPCYRTVTVKDPNLLSEATLASQAPHVDCLADGDDTTAWTSATDAVFTATFAANRIADSFSILQKGLGISEIALRYSEDGTTWKSIDTSVVYDGSDITATFAPISMKRFECSVKGTDIAIIRALLCAESKNVAAADKAALSIVSATAGETVVLPKSGAFGSTITWKSSDTKVISDNGSVVQPKESCTVVMTATVKYMDASETKSFVVAVSGKGGTATGGIGGGRNNAARSDGTQMAASVSGVLDTPNDIPIVPGTSAGGQSLYADVSRGHWAYSYIEQLSQIGAVAGSGEGFEPERQVTRAEYLKMLLNVVVLPEIESENPFTDIAQDAWYTEYVRKALANEIVFGMSENRFAPESGISRQDMAVMTVRALAKIGVAVSDNGQAAFADGGTIASYAQESVAALGALGILGGDENGAFRPNDSLSRAEAAKVVAMIANIVK